MKNRSKTLAEALRVAKEAASCESIIQSKGLPRSVRQTLTAAGYLQEIMRGWYLLTRPGTEVGTTTAWYGSFWSFLKLYLADRFSVDGYCLSAEGSAEFHGGETRVPHQVVVLTTKPSNHRIELIHDTSVILIHEKNFPLHLFQVDGLNIMTMADSLVRLSPSYWKERPRQVELILKIVSDVELLRELLRAEKITACERIAGGLKRVGRKRLADRVVDEFRAIGVPVKPIDAFTRTFLPVDRDISSAVCGRLTILWEQMRAQIMANVPVVAKEVKPSLKIIEQIRKEDAYHSLSIEGYVVTDELIDRIGSGSWDPDGNLFDQEQVDALAARGYYDCFQQVLSSILAADERPIADVLRDDLQRWYRALFLPSVAATLMPAHELAGFRGGRVYIKGSRHIPPAREHVPAAIDTLFALIGNEDHSFVRAVLGHFILTYIHPYMDGNGRIGRFFMNALLVDGCLDWTIIRISSRGRYMQALEKASVEEDVTDFARLVAEEMDATNARWLPGKKLSP